MKFLEMNGLGKCSTVVVAMIAQSLGLTLQRLSHLDPPLPASGVWPTPDQRTHSIRLWRLGVALFITAGLCGAVLQLLLLPLPLIPLVQASIPASNAVLAWTVLKEVPSNQAVLGCFLVLAGIGGALLNTPVSSLGSSWSRQTNLDILIRALTTVRFEVYFLGTLALLAVLVSRQLSLHSTGSRTKQHSAGTLQVPTKKFSHWAWCLSAGISAAHGLLTIKLVADVLVNDRRDLLADLERLQFWALPILFQLFLIAQMWCVAGGLRQMQTSVFFPRLFTVYTVVTQVGDKAFYGIEKKLYWSYLWVLVSTASSLVGVFLLSSRLDPAVDESSGFDNVWGVRHFWQWLKPSVELEEPVHTSFPRLATSRLASPRYDSLRPESPISPIEAYPRSPSGNPRSPSENPRSPAGNPRSPSRDQSPGRLASPAPPPLNRAPSSVDSADGMSRLNSSTYTSFDSITPSITNPDKQRGRHNRVVLSKEQNRILRELGM